jgi:hypothetical protein
MNMTVTDHALRSLKGPNQIFYEWKVFLQFAQTYFEALKVERPLVVEIGTQYGRQRAFYEKFLGATHIGIDISSELSEPTILGDSKDAKTLELLDICLDERKINLLFIDGDHSYEGVKQDYTIYSPLVTDIIAFHDIRHEKGIYKFWDELRTKEKDNPNLSFLSIGAYGSGWCQLGIGVIVKRGREELKTLMGVSVG